MPFFIEWVYKWFSTPKYQLTFTDEILGALGAGIIMVIVLVLVCIVWGTVEYIIRKYKR